MNRNEKRKVRGLRTRHNVRSVAPKDILRLSVFRSNVNIYAQIIDDREGKTVVSASTIDKKISKDIKQPSSVEAATAVGKALAERAKKAGLTKVYFDRGGFRYMGRVKALGDAARAGGLEF